MQNSCEDGKRSRLAMEFQAAEEALATESELAPDRKLAETTHISTPDYNIRFEPRMGKKGGILYAVVGRLRSKGAGSTQTVSFDSGCDASSFKVALAKARSRCVHTMRQCRTQSVT